MIYDKSRQVVTERGSGMYRFLRFSATSVLMFVFAVFFSIPMVYFLTSISFLQNILAAGGIFLLLSFIYSFFHKKIDGFIFKKHYLSGYNQRIYGFCDKIRVSFSIADFIDALKEFLETRADFSVLWLNKKNRSVIYGSPGKITSDMKFIFTLTERFREEKDGILYLDTQFNKADAKSSNEGVLFVFSDYHLFLFSKYLPVYDTHLFSEAFHEFQTYLNRVDTMEKMFALSAISREWSLVAETQKSFLLGSIPEIAGLDIGLKYEALVNVSGDYYDIIPLSPEKTLVVLGDVSGKGLSAALVMGIIVNTIRIMERKDSLETIFRYVDSAIKTMNFEGKFTAMFAGIFDTAEKTLTYIDAGIPEPWMLHNDEIHLLESNCSLLGIIDLVKVNSKQIDIAPGDVFIISTDGLWEIENDKDDMIYNNPDFKERVLEIYQMPVQEFTDEIVRYSKEYAASGELRDDLALLIIKMKG